MRLWSIHPRYLDAKGLVALWREGLLAQKVLQDKTKGYRHHPQLHRFRSSARPTAAIAAYLLAVSAEASKRGYCFDVTKIGPTRLCRGIPETTGQLRYEWEHLKAKLKRRDPARYRACQSIAKPALHPLFRLVPGKIREWEILRPARKPKHRMESRKTSPIDPRISVRRRNKAR